MVGQQGAGLAAFYFHLQPELDQPADGLGAIGRVVLPTGPGIHTFPHFVRQPDCSNRVLAGGGAFFYAKKVASVLYSGRMLMTLPDQDSAQNMVHCSDA